MFRCIVWAPTPFLPWGPAMSRLSRAKLWLEDVLEEEAYISEPKSSACEFLVKNPRHMHLEFLVKNPRHMNLSSRILGI